MLVSTNHADRPKSEPISQRLNISAGIVLENAPGMYTYSALGRAVVRRMEAIARRNMDAISAAEMTFPILQQHKLHEMSGRIAKHRTEMLMAEDNKGRKLVLSPSQEEIAIEFVRSRLHSYKQLPIIFYQIDQKFRDNRPVRGIMRSREFMMLDGYLFSRSEEETDECHASMTSALSGILRECGLDFKTFIAAKHAANGKTTIFAVDSEHGRNTLFTCGKCELSFKQRDDLKGECVECPTCKTPMTKRDWLNIGEVANLGTKYTDKFGLMYEDHDQTRKMVHMANLGFTFSRLMAAIIEQNHDSKGIIWPVSISPFEVVVVPLTYSDPKIAEASLQIHDTLNSNGISAALDDRDVHPGRKFKDADTIGFPYRLIVGTRSLLKRDVEIESRKTGEKVSLSIGTLVAQLKGILRPSPQMQAY